MNRSIALVTTLLTTTCILAPSAARAQEAQPAPASGPARDKAIADAQARFEDGLDRARRGDFDAARLAFLQAYAVLQRPEILFNLALAEQKTGHAVESLRHFRVFERDPSISASDRATARAKIEDLSKLTGHVRVECPAGASISVDGEPTTIEADAPIDVAPGRHLIEGKLGDDVLRQEVSPAAGETTTVRLAFTAEGPGAGGVAYERRSRGRVIVPIVMGAVAAAALGGGIAFAIDSHAKRDDVDAFRTASPARFCNVQSTPTCTQYQSLIDKERQSVTIANVLYASSAVLAVGAIATYALWPKTRVTERAAWVAPTLGGVQAGVTF